MKSRLPLLVFVGLLLVAGILFAVAWMHIFGLVDWLPIWASLPLIVIAVLLKRPLEPSQRDPDRGSGTYMKMLALMFLLFLAGGAFRWLGLPAPVPELFLWTAVAVQMLAVLVWGLIPPKVQQAAGPTRVQAHENS